MERQPSVFSKLRSRNTYDSLANEDEWYIPYNSTSRPNLPTRQSGIGLSPVSPTKPSHSMNALLSSVFSSSNTNTDNAIAGPSSMKTFPIRPSSTPMNTYTSTYNHPSGRRLEKSPSYNSLSDTARTQDRMPSSSSVPTGLQAQNILFSPLNRELRSSTTAQPPRKAYPPSSFNPNPIQSSQPIGSQLQKPRQRTVSAPKTRTSRKYSAANPHEYRAENKRWAVPTMCDMFLLPRPTLLPHEITPPTTPEDEVNEKRLSMKSVDSASSTNHEAVLERGRYREEEREEWADLVRRRGRSLSLGSTAPPPGAPVIGNARARSRERSVDGNRRSRSNSFINALTPSTSMRKRSASFGSRFTGTAGNSRKSSMTRRESDKKSAFSRKIPGRERRNDSSFLNIDHDAFKASGRDVNAKDYGISNIPQSHRMPTARSPSDDYVFISQNTRKRSASMPYSINSVQTRSDPLLSNFNDAHESRYPTMSIPTGRSLQFKQPSVADKGSRGGVVIIAKSPMKRNTGVTASTFRPPAPLDLSKPLPDLPKDDDSPVLPESGPFISLEDEIGIAISPDLGGVEKEKVVIVGQDNEEDMDDTPKSAPLPRPVDPISPKTPSKSRLSDGGSATARAFLAKQQQRARTKRAFQSPVQGPRVAANDPHRLSVGQGQNQGALSTASTPTTASTSISSVLSPASSTTSVKSDGPRRKTALEEAIGRSRASSVGVLEAQQSRFSPTRLALMQGPPNSGDPSKQPPRRTAGITNSVPPPPKVTVNSPESLKNVERDQHRFSSPELGFSVSSPPLDYPISTIPSPRTRSSFLNDNYPPSTTAAVPLTATLHPSLNNAATEGGLLRPGMIHGESTASKMTVYTDASEGWCRVGSSARSTPISDRKDRLSASNSEDSPGQTPDDRDFQGLFFRTPADRNGSFSNTPVPYQNAPPQYTMELPRIISEGLAPIGLGYDMDPTSTQGQIVAGDARRPSDGSESTAEITTPNMSGEDQVPHQYMGYLNPLVTRESTSGSAAGGRAQQQLMAPWVNRPITPETVPAGQEEDDEDDGRSINTHDTHGTAVPILSEGHEFPFPHSTETLRNLAQAGERDRNEQSENATNRTPDGKRRPSHHAPLSPGTFGIKDNHAHPSSSTATTALKLNSPNPPTSFHNYTLSPRSSNKITPASPTRTGGGRISFSSHTHAQQYDHSLSPNPGNDHRHSAAVSFFDDFPTPPTN
ncbi:uncharacterized protein I303_103772 [Kwoniella dejecticola CBS 10117]|uniref:Uncharacterized protein n=1 Tax=Kwoniella dejecticola CBS 10117 TaxID=1296121 RepID=A0A1A6A7P2_9TREE|nr:uncharacterized protein I303_03790 [Kwoniella dejecticola CBS 10117]OBR86072.1 hypothetical protein I303_03790 [Kwoniella dejecticola CBS 10117]